MGYFVPEQHIDRAPPSGAQVGTGGALPQTSDAASAFPCSANVAVNSGGYIAVYIIGLVAVWIFAWRSVQSEPTTHGQDILIPFGCGVGLLWPVVLVYLVFCLPLLVWVRWKGRE